MEPHQLPIGIDFGPFRTISGVWLNNGVGIISHQGKKFIPNCVAFIGTECLIGDVAEIHCNPENTINGINRIIGLQFYDKKVTRFVNQNSFSIINDCGRPKIKINWKGEQKYFAPEEITAMLLDVLKKNAETYIGNDVKETVIAVPAYFNNYQRKAVKDTVNILGLNVLRIISKPSAIAMEYYFLKNDFQGVKNILIYDLGCETVEISIVKISVGSIEIKAVAFDQGFGSDDFDERLMKHVKNEFKRKFKTDLNCDLGHRLQPIVQQTRNTLSFSEEAEIELDSGTVNFRTKVSRRKFEDICSDLFKKTLLPIKKALNDAKLVTSSIDGIVLSGELTIIVIFQHLIQNLFPDKTINTSSKETGAYGAAIFAAILKRDQQLITRPMSLVDITPFSLSIETPGGELSKLISRNTKIPCKGTLKYATECDNQCTITLRVFEGERAESCKNNLLCIVKITEIPLVPAGCFEVIIILSIDENGILEITAEDNCPILGISKPLLVVDFNTVGMSEEQTVKMAVEEDKRCKGKKFKIKDQKRSKGVKRRICD